MTIKELTRDHLESIVAATVTVRRRQKQYFKTRAKQDLIDSKVAEDVLDKLLSPLERIKLNVSIPGQP